MITGIIYKYTSPSNKIYVGKTINESERKHAFLTKERYAGIKIDNARAKSGSKMMIVRVIQNCGIISRKTNYKGQVILPFIFFTYPKCK